MSSCPWFFTVTAILMTMCLTWSSGKNWNLSVSFTRSQIRGFRILEIFSKHRDMLITNNLLPLYVSHWILSRRKYQLDQRVLVTQSPVYQPRNWRRNGLHWYLALFTRFVSWLPPFWKYCVEVGTVLDDLGGWIISCLSKYIFIQLYTYPHMIAWWRVVVCRSHWSLQQHLTIKYQSLHYLAREDLLLPLSGNYLK